jgi:hypothetical protein
MSPESPQRPLADGRDDHAIFVGHAVCSPAVCCQPPAHGLARRVALESLLASDAEEATVTLSYLPGGDRPARVDLLLDGAPSAAVVVPRSFGRLESGRLHKLFVKAEAELTELARWGHQVEEVPWDAATRRAITAPIKSVAEARRQAASQRLVPPALVASGDSVAR